MKTFFDKYFLQTTKYLVFLFAVVFAIRVGLTAIKWNKTFGDYGGYIYLIIGISVIIFVYNRLTGKKNN